MRWHSNVIKQNCYCIVILMRLAADAAQTSKLSEPPDGRNDEVARAIDRAFAHGLYEIFHDDRPIAVQMHYELESEIESCGLNDLESTFNGAVLGMGIGVGAIAAVEAWPYALGASLTPQGQKAMLDVLEGAVRPGPPAQNLWGLSGFIINEVIIEYRK